MINIQKLEELFSEYGPCKAKIEGEVLNIKFYDMNKNYREINIGEKNWKNDEYSWTDKEGTIHQENWTNSIYTNIWNRITKPGYENLAKII